MAGFPLMAFGAGLGKFAEQYQAQQDARQRNAMTMLTLLKYQKEMQDAADEREASVGVYSGLLGGLPATKPVGPPGGGSGGGFPAAQSFNQMEPGSGMPPAGAGGDIAPSMQSLAQLAPELRKPAAPWFDTGRTVPPEAYSEISGPGTTPGWAPGGPLGSPNAAGVTDAVLPPNIDALRRNRGGFGAPTPGSGGGEPPQAPLSAGGDEQVTDASGGETQVAQATPATPGRTTPAQPFGEVSKYSAQELARRIEQASPPGTSLAVKAKILEKQLKLMAPEARIEAQQQLQLHREEINKSLAADRAQHAKELAETRDRHQRELAEQREKGMGWTAIVDPKTGAVSRFNIRTGVLEPATNVPAGSVKMGTGGQAPPDPASVDFVAKKIAAYEMAPLGAYALRTPFGQQVAAKVPQLNPEYDATKYGAKARAAMTFAVGKQGDAVRAFSVSIDHLQTMQEIGDALANNDVRAMNVLKNRVQQELGYSGPIDFNFAKSIVGSEVSKAVIGGVGALKDREELRDSFNAANSPEQLAGVIATAKMLMAGQLAGFKRQHSAAGLNPVDFDKAVSPRAKAEMMGLAAFDTEGPGKAPSAAPAATTGAPAAPAGAPASAKPPAGAAPTTTQPQYYSVGEVIPMGGKRYRVIAVDPAKPDDPEIEEIK